MMSLVVDLAYSNISWQGGGWCNNVRTCVYRKKTHHGSSTYMEKEIAFMGILSNKAKENPGFLSNLTISQIHSVFSVLFPPDLS